ncbi:MAG: hypothetical protein IMZ66_12150, partial [Planctomycetes bacterium]|nr:hypothetical protein [Planctomycetota bacterium]
EGRPVKTPDSKPVAVDEFADVKKAEESLERAKDMLQKQARDLDKVQINVEDLAQGNEDGRRLAEFVRSNYAWAFVPPAGHRTTNAPAGQTMVNAGNLALNLPQDVNGGQVFLNGAEGVNTYTGGTIQVTNGNLSVANDPNAVQQVQVILERLRTNMGQQVAVGSRNIFVDEDVARGAGLGWQAGVNGVRYAVINEGQLLALMDIEQRQPPSAQQAANLPRDVRQQAIVGTQAVLGNGGRVTISLAGDSANTLFYNGNPVAVSHDDYLLVDNGGYVTAVKSGRMQHWTTEAEPVRFPGVPAAVTVPTVGTTVKFEKTLLDASDSLELVTDYTWQGDER